jgi:hypothetical protein
MTFSKMLLKISAALLALTLVACSTESTKKKTVGFNEPDRFEGEGNFRVAAVTIKSTMAARFNEYALMTAKTFNFEACIKDPVGGAVQAALPFAVVDTLGNQKLLYTNSLGCINWEETHSFEPLAEETLFKVRRRIESRNFYKGYAVAEFLFNPWASGGAAILDPRYNTVPAHAPVVELKELSLAGQTLNSANGFRHVQLNLKSVAFQFMGLDDKNTEITPTLGLKQAHNYIFRISPSVIRRTIDKLVVPEVLNTGRMKAILVLLKEKPSNQFTVDNVITSAEVEGDMIVGELTGQISVKFDNISELTSRTIFLVTLVPKANLPGFPRASFWGPLAPGPLGSINVIPSNVDASQLHEKYVSVATEFAKRAIKPVEMYKKIAGVKELNNPSAQLKATMEKFLDGKLIPNQPYPDTREHIQFRTEICNQIFADPALANEKRACPARYGSNILTFSRKSFVDTIVPNSVEREQVPTIHNLSLTTSLGLSKVDSQSTGLNFKAGASFGGNVGLNSGGKFWENADKTSSASRGISAGLNASIGADYSIARVFKKDENTGVTASSTVAVTAEGRGYYFNAEVRKCAVVDIHPNYKASLEKRMGKEVDVARIYCSAGTKLEKRKENYYLINSNSGIAGSPGSYNASNRMIVRGEPMMNFFKSIIDSGFFKFVFSPVKGLEAEEAYLKKFPELYPVYRQNQSEEFPGLLSEE